MANFAMVGEKKQRRWLKATVYGVVVIGLSVGLTYFIQYLWGRFDISSAKLAPGAYLIVFLTTLLCNASIMVPVAIHTSVMMAAASVWDPALVAFIASVAGALGEITGYYAGYLGKRIMIGGSTPGYNKLVGWVNRYGPWAIFVIALQPVLPVDIAGLTAGVSKMPLWKFLLPCWAGKFPKYILFCYFGSRIFRLLPLWF